MYSFLIRRDNGKIWTIGRERCIWNLCGSWNFATNPARPMSELEHKKSNKYARTIMATIRSKFVYNRDYKELSNGSLWPLSVKKVQTL